MAAQQQREAGRGVAEHLAFGSGVSLTAGGSQQRTNSEESSESNSRNICLQLSERNKAKARSRDVGARPGEGPGKQGSKNSIRTQR